MGIQTPKMLGDANKFNILNALRKEEVISRVELAKQIGMSSPAVSNNISRLLELGLVQSVGRGSADFGRKPTLLRFNKEFQYVIGIDIGEENIKLALGNLKSEIVCFLEVSVNTKAGASSVLEEAKKNIKSLLRKTGVELEKVGVIAISVPGLVDKETGKVSLSTIIDDFEGIDIYTFFTEAFNKPILVENDVDMAIVGEHFVRHNDGCDNLLFVKMGIGMASRIMISGKMYRGTNHAAGEIGYMLIDSQFIRKKFHSRGALEQVICNTGIDTFYRAECEKAGIKCNVNEMITLAKLIDMESKGDEIAQSVLSLTLNYLSMALVNAISILDVNLIVLGGDLECLSEANILSISKFCQWHIPFVPRIVTSKLGGAAGIGGCICTGVKLLEEEWAKYW